MSDLASYRRQHILCVNAGSSSLKLALYEFGQECERLLIEGVTEEITSPRGTVRIQLAGKPKQVETGYFSDHQSALDLLLRRFHERGMHAVDAAGHRVVHGGPDYQGPTRITPAVLERIAELTHLAPLHLPANLACIDVLSARMPKLPQVACFDTAFHSQMPNVAKRLPLPHAFWEQGLRRYGFHGLSYESVLAQLAAARHGRTIIAHLGNGASLSAVADGAPLDTTMGFTPTGGIMMGTRSGDLDPGVLVYLMRRNRYDVEDIERIVNHESGLQGISGVTSNMEILLSRAQELQCNTAIELFVYQIRQSIGALSAVLGGLDQLVFTGGIGERAAPIREMVCTNLEYLGVSIDGERNRRHDHCISASAASCRVFVVPTNEDRVIARQTNGVLMSPVDSI